MDESTVERPGLRPADVVLMSGSTLACAVLVLAGRWVPGWWQSALAFAFIAAGLPLCRWLSGRFRRAWFLDVLASFWLGLAAPLGHASYGPVVDVVTPGLRDRELALLDLRLFRGHPSAWAGHLVPGWAMDALLACYYTYFLWPAVVAAVLYFRRDRAVFEQFSLALALCFTLNFALYALVPAVGPRFYLAGQFDGPLRGAHLAPYLESLMRTPTFLRDCFPSGHTAGTALVLIYAYRHARRVFWPMLPVACGLVGATVAGRFHYGVDLVFALPLAALVAGAAAAVVPAASPAPLRRPLPAWRWTS